jgi:hypothetical protein
MTAHVLGGEDPHAVGVFAARGVAEIPKCQQVDQSGRSSCVGEDIRSPRSISPTLRLRSGLFPIIADPGLKRQRS